MILDPPALYLECRYDRTQSLRAITRRLRSELYDHGPLPDEQRSRLKARLARAQRHLATLTEGGLL